MGTRERDQGLRRGFEARKGPGGSYPHPAGLQPSPPALPLPLLSFRGLPALELVINPWPGVCVIGFVGKQDCLALGMLIGSVSGTGMQMRGGGSRHRWRSCPSFRRTLLPSHRGRPRPDDFLPWPWVWPLWERREQGGHRPLWAVRGGPGSRRPPLMATGGFRSPGYPRETGGPPSQQPPPWFLVGDQGHSWPQSGSTREPLPLLESRTHLNGTQVARHGCLVPGASQPALDGSGQRAGGGI